MTPPVAPVAIGPPDEIYVCFMKNWGWWHIHNWTTKATDNYHKFVLAGNKLLDTIDAHDSEKEPLSSNHPDVHAFSSLLDKMPPTDMQADVNGELERLRAENEKLRMDRGFAIGWITALANNPYKPMTWMQTREAAADCLATLQGDAP